MLNFQHEIYNSALLTRIRSTFLFITLRVKSSKKIFTPSQYNGVWKTSTLIERGVDYV